jgi:peptide subunit release factor RF-3
MTVSPEERFHQRQPRYSKEEFAQRGDALYEAQIRSQVEEGNHGKIVAIDIETGAFEVADEILTATDRLFERIPDAQPWIVRIGHRAVHRFGARSLIKPV